MYKDPIIRDCSVGRSFYKLVDDLWKDTESYNRVLHRLCSLMRKVKAETVIIEYLNEGDDNEVEEERKALTLCINRKVKFESVIRLTFLTKRIKDSNDIERVDEKDFLGHAIIINARWRKKGETQRKSYMLRAIISLPVTTYGEPPERLPLFNSYFHVYRSFECVVGLDNNNIRSYSIIGTFFSQQNSITSVCAHSALKMLINNLPEGHSKRRALLTTQEINNILKINLSKGNIEGLVKEQVEKVFKALKLKTVQQNFFNAPNLDYATYVHYLVESSCPCLLSFTTNTSSHVVPILGHTIKSDMWRPEAEVAYNLHSLSRLETYIDYRPASMWIDNFLIHDDNFGMYLSLPVDSLRRTTIPKYDPTFRAWFVIGLVPYELGTSGTEAEWASQHLVRDMLKRFRSVPNKSYWLDILYRKNQAPLVTRTALLKLERYRTHLGFELSESKRRKDSNGRIFTDDIIMEMTRDLPEHFWFSELTLPDLYTTNRTKLIDVLYSSQKPPASDEDKVLEKCILIRFPGFAMKFKNGTIEDLIATDVYGHYPLFRVSRELLLFEG